ncbi:ImmA/IrrE family metallo-endopeptidase [Prescottella equi]|uniref:ImmA/IrrE family metallo-endopeptidase n=1 Tax=Rhodococcus hoagii TaxID=43767 RepID=UPI003D99797B
MNNHPNSDTRSILTQLRAVIPARTTIGFGEALRVAELHANRLLELHHVRSAPTPSEVVTELPKLHVERISAPVSGASFWNGHSWVIQLNRTESRARQRFTLAHEYKHIIDHGATDRLYPGSRRLSSAQQAERAADYFAGCLLVPRRLLKRAWGSGTQRPTDLAQRFGVSEAAITVRLAQTGLVDRTDRCGTPRYRVAPPSPRPPRRPPPLQGAWS